MADLDDPRLSLGSDPVPGDEPAGENAREDAAYETLSAEVSKMDVDGPTAVDWRKVTDLSQGLLRDRTKDYLVAAYFAYALGREEGLRGLAVGLGVIARMVETFWDSGFPPPRRERARVGAVDWLAERFGPQLDDLEVDAGNAEDVLLVLTMAEDVDRLLDEKAEKTQANLGDLLRPLRAKRQDAQYIVDQRRQAEEAAAATDPAPEEPTETEADAPPTAEAVVQEVVPPAAAPAAVAEPPAQAAGPAAPQPSSPSVAPAAVGAPPQLPSSPGPELDRAISAFRSTMLGFARSLRAADPADPRAYGVHRSAIWLQVVALPPDKAGVTELPAPNGGVASAIDALVAADNHAEAVAACEAATEDRMFWLDPHRHVANALGAMGQEAARSTVVAEVAAFLGRFPRLLEFKFQGGRPFADDQTRLWLKETVLKSGGGGDVGDAADDGGVGSALSEARGLAANGKQDEAAELLTRGARGAGGGRAGLLWDLAKADLCLSMGLAGPAYQMLTALEERHRAVDLDTWEPALAERLTTLRLQSLKRGGAEDILVEDQVNRLTAELAARLYRLNMVAALGIMRG